MADHQEPCDEPRSKRARTALRRALLDPECPGAAKRPVTVQLRDAQRLVPPPVCPSQSVRVSTVPTDPTVSKGLTASTLSDSGPEIAAIVEKCENVTARGPLYVTHDEIIPKPQTEGHTSSNAMLRGLVVPDAAVQIPKERPSSFSNLLLPMITPVRPGTAPAMDIRNLLTQPDDEISSELPRPAPEVFEEPPSPTHLTEPSASTDSDGSDGSSASLPLFEGSPLTNHDCMVSILAYAHANHLSGTSTCELIRLLEILLPQPNNLPKSTTLFKRYFKDNANEIQMYFFCSICWSSRNSPQDICSKCAGQNPKVSYFITCPLEQQLQRLYARPGFVDLLQYRNNRKKENDANIEDVYDGKIYKEAQKDILKNQNNISFTWYTDGIQVFEVSTFDLWLSMLTINELPPDERHKPENVLISGIWGTNSKPHPNIFLLPMYHDISKVSKGVALKPHGSEQEIIVCGFLLFGTCDCPAKSKFMNMKGHAGYYSCPKCLIKGEKSERSNNVMVFPHENNLELRSEENYVECFNEGVKSKDGCKGCFGPTVLFYMFSGPFIAGMTIDSMHSQYMGIGKQLLKLWFDEKFSNEPFSLRSKIPEINKRLRGLNLPHFVQRLPVDVDKALCYFKASLCRNLFFYILPIILHDILKPPYFNNFMKLVTGVALLNKNSISHEDLVRASLLLNEFSEEFQTLYGLRHMSSNIHAVRHLAKCVEEIGPLFLLSCFRLEDLNGKICGLVHGTRHVLLQINNHLGLLTDLPLLINNVESECVKNFCLQSIRRSKNFTLTEKVSKEVYVVGKIVDVSDHSIDIHDLVSSMYDDLCSVRYFDRLYKSKQLYVSNSYKEGSRVSAYIRYRCDLSVYHGKILQFVKVTTASASKYFAFIQRSHNFPFHIERFSEFCGAEDVDLVPVSQLLNVCFGLALPTDKVYIVDPLNSFEME